MYLRQPLPDRAAPAAGADKPSRVWRACAQALHAILQNAAGRGRALPAARAGKDRFRRPRWAGDRAWRSRRMTARACLRVFAGGERLVRLGDVEQMMWNECALLARRLGCADLKIAIQSDRIATDDFAGELLAQDGWQVPICRRRSVRESQPAAAQTAGVGRFIVPEVTGTPSCRVRSGKAHPRESVLPNRRNASARMNERR